MHARILAAVPFEFGDPIPGSEEQRSEGDSEGGGGDRAAADVYANLYGGSLVRAAELVLQARKHYPESAVLPYLQGRIALLEGNAAAATGHLETARKMAPKDALILRALGDSYAAQGKTKAAIKAYDEALAINPDHIASHLGRARVRVANRKDLIDAEVDLTSVTVGKRRKRASRGQQGWAYLVLARLAINRGQLAQAKQHISQAKRHKPDRDPLFQDELAGVLIDSFQLGEAEKAIHKSKQLMKGRPHPYHHMARIHLLHGRPKAALEELKHAKGLQYAASNLLRARIYIELKRLPEASREVDRALGMAGELLEAHIVKAKVLAAQGHGVAAETKLKSLLVEHPTNSMLLTAYGEVYARMGKQKEAQQQFLAALQHDKHAFTARLKLAEVYMEQGDYEEARKKLAEARNANFGNIMILNKLAAVEFGQGVLTEAATIYQEAKSRAPNDPNIYLDLARVYTEHRKLKLANKEIKAAARRNSDDRGDLSLARGRLALARGEAPKAVRFLATATKKQPKNPEAWDLLVRAYLMNNDESSARRSAGEMTSHLGGTPEAEASMGRVLLNQGQSTQAIRRLNKAKQLLAQHPRPPLMRAKILVLLGRAYQDNGKLAEAAGQYEEAANVCGRCPEPCYRRGLVQDERGETDAAIRSLEKALRLNERFSEVYYDLGQVYEGAGRKTLAIENYRKYLKRNPPKALAKAAQEAIQNLQ
jgi:tetratricopeptide (TPR) repeat protein